MGPFDLYLQYCGIAPQNIMHGSPEQNGVVERCNLPKYLWSEALKMTFYILNRVLSKFILNFRQKENVDDEVDPPVMVETPQLIKIFAQIPLRSTRGRRPTIGNDFMVYLSEDAYDIGDIVDLKSYQKVVSCPQRDMWKHAMKKDMESMLVNGA
ncbi:hypothetical protein CR513_54228, partial [Mucuna pruriens]